MRQFIHPLALAATACLGLSAAAAQGDTPPGAVTQATPPAVSQKPSVPPLKLSDDQRAKIKQALRSQNTELDLALKPGKSAKDFDPVIGATTPKGVTAHALPPPVIYEIPLLKRYTYLKLKHQVVIVNPINHKIADVFAEE